MKLLLSFLLVIVPLVASAAENEATALLRRGVAEAESNPASARASFESAAAKFSKSGDFFSAWMARFCVAASEMSEAHWDAAAKEFETALTLLSVAKSSDVPVSLDGLAAIAPMLGEEMPAGLPSGNSAALKPILLRVGEMLSRDHLGYCFVELGNLERAEAELKRAKELSAKFSGMFDGPIDEHIGELRRRQARGSTHPKDRELLLLIKGADELMKDGRYDDALQAFEGVVQTAGENVERRAQAITAIATVHIFRGNYGAAATELEKAIALYGTLKNPDPIRESQAWVTLTEAYIGLGAHDSAAQALETARELVKKIPNPLAGKIIDVLSASLEMNAGRSAVGNVTTALEEFVANVPQAVSPETLELLDQLAAVGANPLSAANTQVDLDVRGAPADPVAAVLALFLQGHAHFVAGRSKAAREVLTKVLERSIDIDMKVASLLLIGATYWQEGNGDEASRWFQKAADQADENVGDIADDELLARYLGRDNRQLSFDATIGMLVQTGNVDQAFAYAERARARAFLKMIGNHRVAPRRGGDDALVREADALRLRIAQSKSDPAAKDRYRALMRRVKTSNPEYASLTRVEPLNVAAVRAELPADVTLVSYFLTSEGGGAHAWILDQKSVEHVWLPVSDAALRRVVCWSSRFRSRDARGAKLKSPECNNAATAAEAFDLLFAPLRRNIRHHRLFLVPHGVLHQIPFCALYDAKRRRYLIDDYTIQFIPSASALRFLRDKESPFGGHALIIGNPIGAGLEGAQREVLAIARDLGTQPVIGAEAKESLLYQLDGSTDILHIGVHGTFEPASPLFSRIALAPGDGHDGNLEVHEILSDVDLRGVNLVVLSACRTAIGERTGGDDVVGLTRAILYAGSPGVISTLWDIDDAAAAMLMEEFYCRLLGGDTAAAALREAQRLLRNNARYSDPQYWGAFMLTGDPAVRFHRSR